MRLIKMDHVMAIKIINKLQPLFVEIIQKNIYKIPDEMYSCAPLVDIMSIKHERADRSDVFKLNHRLSQNIEDIKNICFMN